MLTTKLEVLVDLGPKEGAETLAKTISELKSMEEVKEVVFKDGALLVETTLPSSRVLELVSATSGKRAVLQGFGDTQSAVAMLSSFPRSPVVGVVRFQQRADGLVVDGTLDGLAPGAHGLHVHHAGDISQGCASIGGHYNPLGTPHGAPHKPPTLRHAGDLGNIQADQHGRASFRIVDNVLKVWDIIGRSIAVTDRKDDLGEGTSPASKVDGDSGQPIACGIIARSAAIYQNTKRICACDGVLVWDERDRPLAGHGRRNCCGKHKVTDEVKPCCKV